VLTEKVPLNLIEVILAQGSQFQVGDFQFLQSLIPRRKPADLPLFCMEQINGNYKFFYF
jgi:hypothetical protein